MGLDNDTALELFEQPTEERGTAQATQENSYHEKQEEGTRAAHGNTECCTASLHILLLATKLQKEATGTVDSSLQEQAQETLNESKS